MENEIKKNLRRRLIEILQYLADEDSLSDYKRNLSYVHVINDFSETLDTLFRFNKKRLGEMYEEENLSSLFAFYEVYLNLLKANKKNSDVPLIFSLPEWEKVNLTARNLAGVL